MFNRTPLISVHITKASTAKPRGFPSRARMNSYNQDKPTYLPIIKINDFAELYIRKTDLRSVTVEGQDVYWVYVYEGPVSEIENVRLLLSWKDEYTASSNHRFVSYVRIRRWISLRFNVLSRTLEHRDGVSLFQGTARF
jgi:hypothetical protein